VETTVLLEKNAGEAVVPQEQEQNSPGLEPEAAFSPEGVSPTDAVTETPSPLPAVISIDQVDVAVPDGKPAPNAKAGSHPSADVTASDNPNLRHNFSPSPTALEHSDAVNRLSSPGLPGISQTNAASIPGSPTGGEETVSALSGTISEPLPAQPEKPIDAQSGPLAQTGQSPVPHRGEGTAVASQASVNPASAEPTPLGQSEVLVERIGSSVMQAANGGKVLRMRLHPPELGVLQIEVTSHEGTVTARLNVENARAHQAIRENLSQLQEMLHKTQAHIDRIELNTLDSQSGLESSSRQAGGNSSNSNEQPLPANGQLGNENADSQGETNSAEKPRHARDWGKNNHSLSGIDIQV
jgi:flagellar hook-length control protein FliK